MQLIKGVKGKKILTGVNLFLSVIMMKQNVISFVFRYPVLRAVKGLKGNQNIFLHEGCVGGWGEVWH